MQLDSEWKDGLSDQMPDPLLVQFHYLPPFDSGGGKRRTARCNMNLLESVFIPLHSLQLIILTVGEGCMQRTDIGCVS